MHVRAALLLLLLASAAVAQVPPEAVPPIPTLPTQQDDAGTGGDAPNAPDAAFQVLPGRVYEGSVLGMPGDQDDFYAFEAPAGSAVHFLVLGLVGCFDIVDESQTPLASGCALTPAMSVAVVVEAARSETWFLHYHWFTPDAYRFSFAIDASPPRLAPLDPAPVTGLTPLGAPDGEPVVVAVIDTGVNPYHEWFAAPGLTAHPSTFVAGFPAAAVPLELTVEAPDYESARAADADVWRSLSHSSYDSILDRFDAQLYTIPGTRIIGAVSFGEFTDVLPALEDAPSDFLPILDDNGHGTLSAALAGGGQVDDAVPEVLLVIVEVPAGGFEAGLRWAARQDYIDVVSFSMGRKANIPAIADDAAAGVEEVVAAGKAILVASGNGLTSTAAAADRCSTYTSPYTGPLGVTRIGASEGGGAASTWHCTPVDAIAATNLPSARHDALDGTATHTGTSAAAPQAAGHLANLLARARDASLDVTPPRALEHLLAAGTPPATPSPAGNADHGYGQIDEEALERAWQTLQADNPAPRRELEQWRSIDQLLRRTIWQPEASLSATVRLASLQNDAGSGADAGDVPGAALLVRPGTFDGRLDGMGADAHDWYAFEGRPGQTWTADVRGAYGAAELYDPLLRAVDEIRYDPLNGGTLTVETNRAGLWYLHIANDLADAYTVTLEPEGDPDASP